MDYTLRLIEKSLQNIADENLPPIISPPPHVEADLAIPFPSEEDADNLAEKAESEDFDFLSNIEVQNNFFNMTLDKSWAYKSVLKKVSSMGESYGELDKNSGKKAFVEYSSPNVAKPIGIGHFRATVIGESLSRIYEATGFDVKRVNYLGDWGTQFGQVITAYKKWGDEKTLEENPLKNLKELYVRFQKEAEDDESLHDQAREVLNKLEEGDEEMKELWKKFREISIEEFKEVYKKLSIEFDEYGGESFVVEDAKREVENCLEKGVCKEGEDGAIVVEDLNSLPTFVLRRSDDSTLYMTRDLAELRKRAEDHDYILYVVGNEQELHFRQLFALARELDILRDANPKHISFGLVTADGSRMSTRAGTHVELEDLMEKAVSKAEDIISEKNPDLENKSDVARQVGIGSIIYNDLGQDRNKNISFDWDEMLDFNAGSGPYLQYTHARIKSILRKADGVKDPDEFIFEDSSEFDVSKRLMMFPDAVEKAMRNDAPHMICGFLEKLAADFNRFYEQVSVLKTEDDDLKQSRLALISAVALVLKSGLELLNIEAPEKM